MPGGDIRRALYAEPRLFLLRRAGSRVSLYPVPDSAVLGPHAPSVSADRHGPAVARGRPAVVAHLHRQLIPDERGVDAVRRRDDFELGPRVDPRLRAGVHQALELIPEVIAPVEVVVPEHRGRAGVREGVRVAHANLVAGERPVRLGGTGIVVIDEGHRAAGPEADDAGRPPFLVHQPPKLRPAASLLENTLGGEVKGGAYAAGGVDPVDDALPVRILVVLQTLAVVEGVPVLAHGELGHARAGVLARKLAAVPFAEVESNPAKPDVVDEPLDPLAQVLLHP